MCVCVILPSRVIVSREFSVIVGLVTTPVTWCEWENAVISFVFTSGWFVFLLLSRVGNAVVQLVEALLYKPKCHRFGSLWGHWDFFRWPDPSMALGSTEPQREISTRDLPSGGKGSRCVGLPILSQCADFVKILGASTFWIPRGLSRPIQGELYLCLLAHVDRIT